VTAVHHDGFTLWPSEYSDIGVQTHLEGRDLVGEYVDVCRRQDIRVGLYFSPEQWYHEQYPTEAFGHWETLKSYSYKQLERIDDPGELTDFEAYFHDVKRQLEELVSDYGRIDLVWFDHSPWFGTLDDRTGTLVDVIESAQPGAVIDARDHFFKGYGHYDADAENYLPDVPIDGWVEPPSPGVTTGGTSRTTSTRTTGGHSTPSSTPRASAVTCFSTSAPGPTGRSRMRCTTGWTRSRRGWTTAGRRSKASTPDRGRHGEPPATRTEGTWYLHVRPDHDTPITVGGVPAPNDVRHLRTDDRLAWTHENDQLRIELSADRRQPADEVLAVSWPATHHHLL
jgi:alpha-L-fucosidase